MLFLSEHFRVLAPFGLSFVATISGPGFEF